MKTNWLWDSRLTVKQVKQVFKDENHPKFEMYAEKLLARVSNPKIVFKLIDKVSFCKKWPAVKKRMIKDRWLKDKIFLWQTIYESILEQLKIEGIKLRQPSKIKLSYQIRDVAKQIRDTRMKAGLKQVDLAKKLGVIQQYISKIETGRENCSIETLKQIADALNKNLTIKFQ